MAPYAGRVFSAVALTDALLEEPAVMPNPASAGELPPDIQAFAFAASMDGIAIVDVSGRYVYVNQAHAQIYGFASAADLIGESWRCCYRPQELARIEQTVLPALAHHGKWRGGAIGTRRDGGFFEQEVSL